MQIFADKVRKPCCLQEFAMQKLRPLRVYSRNRNHGGRECMKVVIRIFPRSELILLTQTWTCAARSDHSCLFPEEPFQAYQQWCGSRGAGLGAATFISTIGAASYNLMKP